MRNLNYRKLCNTCPGSFEGYKWSSVYVFIHRCLYYTSVAFAQTRSHGFYLLFETDWCFLRGVHTKFFPVLLTAFLTFISHFVVLIFPKLQPCRSSHERFVHAKMTIRRYHSLQPSKAKKLPNLEIVFFSVFPLSRFIWQVDTHLCLWGNKQSRIVKYRNYFICIRLFDLFSE